MMSAESNSEKSVSYQKKDGCGHARPSFFWYDNDKDLKVCFLVTHVIYVSHRQRIKYEDLTPDQKKAIKWKPSTFRPDNLEEKLSGVFEEQPTLNNAGDKTLKINRDRFNALTSDLRDSLANEVNNVVVRNNL